MPTLAKSSSGPSVHARTIFIRPQGNRAAKAKQAPESRIFSQLRVCGSRPVLLVQITLGRPMRRHFVADPASTSDGHLTADQVFRDFAPRVYNLARRMLGNDADAEDVTQDVLLQVVRK